MDRTKGQLEVDDNLTLHIGNKNIAAMYLASRCPKQFRPTDEEQIVNAKFICKAVNYHDRLVEKLDDAVMAINNRHLVADDAVWKSLTSGFKQLLSEIEKE